MRSHTARAAGRPTRAERAFADAATQADALGWSFIARHSRGMMQSLNAPLDAETCANASDLAHHGRIRARSKRETSWSTRTSSARARSTRKWDGCSRKSPSRPPPRQAVIACWPSAFGATRPLLRGDVPAALRFYQQAAEHIDRDRAGYFDPRRRGTVIERFTSVLVNRALAQLQLGMYDEAFAAFEAMRSRGLSELAAALASPSVSEDDRAWLARLTRVEAQLSAVQNRVVRRGDRRGRGHAG